MDRRTFVYSTGFVTLNALILANNWWRQGDTLSDENICDQKFKLAVANKFYKMPINKIVVEFGKLFIDTKYCSHTLDKENDEKLVVNLHEFDCVTFVENCVALARCVKMNKMSYDGYKEELQFIRYRNGIIDGYSSRLHYTTDAWCNAEEKQIMKVITKEMFGEANVEKIPKPINFMTKNREMYQSLISDNVNYNKMLTIEARISKRNDYFIRKESPRLSMDKIIDGDLIGITTIVKGMDISHLGIANRTIDGKVHLLHASSDNHRVLMTKKSLVEYISSNDRQSGIILARLNEIG
jgi:hypothetical protein